MSSVNSGDSSLRSPPGWSASSVLSILPVLVFNHWARYLPAGTSSARLAWVRRCEGVVEVVVERAAGDDEVPAFGAVEHIVLAAKAGLVFADDFVERVIHRDGVGWVTVMEVEDGDGGVRLLDLGSAVGDIVR